MKRLHVSESVSSLSFFLQKAIYTYEHGTPLNRDNLITYTILFQGKTAYMPY